MARPNLAVGPRFGQGLPCPSDSVSLFTNDNHRLVLTDHLPSLLCSLNPSYSTCCPTTASNVESLAENSQLQGMPALSGASYTRPTLSAVSEERTIRVIRGKFMTFAQCCELNCSEAADIGDSRISPQSRKARVRPLVIAVSRTSYSSIPVYTSQGACIDALNLTQPLTSTRNYSPRYHLCWLRTLMPDAQQHGSKPLRCNLRVQIRILRNQSV